MNKLHVVLAFVRCRTMNTVWFDIFSFLCVFLPFVMPYQKNLNVKRVFILNWLINETQILLFFCAFLSPLSKWYTDALAHISVFSSLFLFFPLPPTLLTVCCFRQMWNKSCIETSELFFSFGWLNRFWYNRWRIFF